MRPFGLVVLSVERAVVVGPHLQQVLECLFQPLEPLGDRREREAETERLLFVPAGAEPDHAAAAGQYVERGHRLREQARMPVVHASDDGEQFGAFAVSGQESERRVCLEHVVLCWPDTADLEEVIHHRQVAEAGCVGRPGDCCELRPERGRAVRPGEVRNLQTEFHPGVSFR